MSKTPPRQETMRCAGELTPGKAHVNVVAPKAPDTMYNPRGAEHAREIYG